MLEFFATYADVDWSARLRSAALVTAALSVAGFVLAALLGSLLTWVQRGAHRGLERAADVYVQFIRSVPLLALLLAIYFVLPQAGVTLSGFWAGVLGLGLQGSAYGAEAMLALQRFDAVAVVDPKGSPAWCAEFAAQHGCRVSMCEAREAVRGAQLVLTATRSKTRVFDGAWLEPGVVVIATGTSLPDGTELDNATLQRASRVLVEWKPQSLVEACEVVLGLSSGALDRDRIADLTDLYAGRTAWRDSDDDIVVFKSVGIGLADVACAWLALERFRAP
jgi:His/Glu/Gln/Arg/opine family amino acid ABC transporter permease subunit